MKNVLIADDNVIMRNMLKFYLKRYDVEVQEVDDGIKAIRKFESIDFDIAFLDIHMPNLDGMNVVKFLRDNYVDSHIVIISSNIDEDLIMKLSNYGVSEFLSKPLDVKKFQHIMETLMTHED